MTSIAIPSDLVGLLTELVRIPSVNPMGRNAASQDEGYLETAISTFLAAFFDDLHLAYREQLIFPGRSNLIATYEAPNARHTLLWDAHQDTVPIEGMTIPPFDASIEGGRLYGRGACDVKGGMAAMLWAFRRL